VAGLISSLRTHADVFSEPELADAGDTGEEPHGMSTTAAVLLLLLATILTAIGAEILVGAVGGAARAMGMTDLIEGFIVVAVVGNAAEHFSAVVFARRGQMQLAINIARDSSLQSALLAAPVLVLFSWVLGIPMNLVFHPFELFGLALAVFAVTFVSLDGESNWYEGLLVRARYVIVALATYFVPAQAKANGTRRTGYLMGPVRPLQSGRGRTILYGDANHDVRSGLHPAYGNDERDERVRKRRRCL